MAEAKRVMIIGGTGLLGYYAGKEFLERGHRVATMAIDDADAEPSLPEGATLQISDVFHMSSEELEQAMTGFDIMVYAMGPDDRTIPPAPAARFFKEKLIDTSERVFKAARKAGVGRAILLGSYFSHFHRLQPELHLDKRHPYIAARLQQEEALMAAGGNDMEVVILQLPYIFGFLPGRIPLWREIFLQRFRKLPVVLYPKGGSAMTCVSRVAAAVCNSVEQEWEKGAYPIVEENMEWKEMFGIMYEALGLKLRFIHVPWWLASPAGWYIMLKEGLRRKEPGLHYGHIFRDIIGREFYLEPNGHTKGTSKEECRIREAIAATARACYPEE